MRSVRRCEAVREDVEEDDKDRDDDHERAAGGQQLEMRAQDEEGGRLGRLLEEDDGFDVVPGLEVRRGDDDRG